MRLTDWHVRTGYHPPSSTLVIDAHERVRDAVRRCGEELARLVPNCAESERMLDRLDEALMYANAAIARRHPDNIDAEGRA